MGQIRSFIGFAANLGASRRWEVSARRLAVWHMCGPYILMLGTGVVKQRVFLHSPTDEPQGTRRKTFQLSHSQADTTAEFEKSTGNLTETQEQHRTFPHFSESARNKIKKRVGFRFPLAGGQSVRVSRKLCLILDVWCYKVNMQWDYIVKRRLYKRFPSTANLVGDKILMITSVRRSLANSNRRSFIEIGATV